MNLVHGAKDVVAVVDGIKFAQVVVLTDLLPNMSKHLLRLFELFYLMQVSEQLDEEPEVGVNVQFGQFVVLSHVGLKNADGAYEGWLELELVSQQEL